MLTLEFHSHTIFSKDSLVKPADLLAACRRKGIDRIVITDHNTIRGALVAQALDPTRVILGEEIMTTKGELLAAFVSEEIPAGLSPQETIAQLRAQAAFISVSHPFDTTRAGAWQTSDLLDILPLIDAIEAFNSRCIQSSFNQHALAFAQQHHLLQTVGSDAHTLRELGRATQALSDFHDANSLKIALASATYHTQYSSPFIHLSSRFAVWYKQLSRRSQQSSSLTTK